MSKRDREKVAAEVDGCVGKGGGRKAEKREEMLCMCVKHWWTVGQHIAKLLILPVQPTHAAWTDTANTMAGRANPNLRCACKSHVS